MKEESMTIEDLAQMVQKGFEGVASKAQVEHLEEQIAHELKAIRKQLLGVVYRPEFEDLEERVKDLENMLAMPSKKAA
jgi:hypothetical protein